MKKAFGLLGEKLAHSFSPMIHSFLGDYGYTLYEIDPGNLDAFMTNARFDGINVTIPYKQSVMPYCATLSEEARMIGSVNTIIKDEDGILHGHNTDYHGFCAMLQRGGINPEGKKAIELGDGGTARTVRAALCNLGAREIVTVSRRGENHFGNIERHHDAEIIVNTTPVGMYPGNGACLISLAEFPKLSGVADVIYNPLRTKLLIEAESMGVPCTNGLAMLAAQAEMASRLFLSEPARPELVDAIIEAMLKKTMNIALIGMPGCGKTSVGRVLAEAVGRQFVDIDEEIEAAAGKTIPEIFAEGGEEAFRRWETDVLSGEAKKSGIVIATGGGVVTKPENYGLLRQNSLIIYLKRELSELITDGRPLSQTSGVSDLAKQRLPLYESWSDHEVQVEATPQQTAARIQEIM